MNRHQKNNPVEKYKTYLRLERGLSENTVEAYLDDLKKLFRFADEEQRPILQIEYVDLQQFVAQLYDLDISTRSQARIISGIKSFYRFLVLEDYLSRDPTELLEAPKIGMKLPETLTLGEINRLI